ncbi:MAG: DUF2085 domain-containing protein, partial [Chloroflexota bacterium]
APFNGQKLKVILSAARDSNKQNIKKLGKKHTKRVEKSMKITRADRITYWISKNYMLAINLFLFLYVGLPFVAPVLVNAGLPGLAKPIYSVYSATCHQLGFRSWFMFGDQPAYPRAAAQVDGLTTFGEATGLNEEDLWSARQYRGGKNVGYKVAFCERDVGIYAAMLLFGLIYVATKQKIPALPWYLWVLIGLGPIGIDGFSQLLSQIPGFPLLTYRESTPLLRTLTGALFGFTTAWFGFPIVKETMEESQVLAATKLKRLKKLGSQEPPT